MIEIKNAKVSGTRLGYEDHGLLTAFVTLDYGGSGQGFGGYAFDTGPGRDVSGFAGWFINGVLKALDVDSWEKLSGIPCRVRAEHEKVHAIGHFIEDRWFDPSEWKPGSQS